MFTRLPDPLHFPGAPGTVRLRAPFNVHPVRTAVPLWCSRRNLRNLRNLGRGWRIRASRGSLTRITVSAGSIYP